MNNCQVNHSTNAAVIQGVETLQHWPDNMRQPDAARYTGLSESLLAKMRMPSDPRTGPPFARVGKAIIYRRADLDAWLASQVEHAA